MLLAMDNKWHDGAVSSHLLALAGSKYYRQQVRLMNRLHLINLEINDYVKISKLIHELTRTTGIDENGIKMSES